MSTSSATLAKAARISRIKSVTSPASPPDGVTLVAGVITASAGNTLTGSGVNQVITGIALSPDTGAGSEAGNVSINFGSTPIRSFTLTYGSGTGTISDPTFAHIGIGDISFMPVPEMNPAWPAFGSCGSRLLPRSGIAGEFGTRSAAPTRCGSNTFAHSIVAFSMRPSRLRAEFQIP